jgi:hypothetical protein
MRVPANMHAHEYISASFSKRSTFAWFGEKAPRVKIKRARTGRIWPFTLTFPKTMGEIQKASRDQLAHWYRLQTGWHYASGEESLTIASRSD